ncbi:delta-type opioid receptor-like [Strongylocentrotus purpuratus]|uniref:G-protein coupled receptors family 1 profile domain-containing protein n=1 Tax=Strongylocentrotus purpuratus TaxID=7668 RepID=A0A7M7T1B0_STRPU|nr:delta-type opioid receptor-like [Strongylocentrotus purpuratus]
MEEDTAQTTNSQASDATAVPWVWLPMEWTWWVIAQLVSAILGICGNLLVMLVLFNKDRVRRSTDTLIGALAFADFLTSVFFIPHPRIATLPSDTWLAQFYCRIIHTSQIKWVAAVASVFTLTAISLERYLAIAHPLFFLRNVNPARTSMCIFIIWVAAFATNSYQVVVGHAAGNACVVMFPSQSARFAIGLSVFIVKFFLPMMVMILAQIMTAVFLHRQSLQFQEGNSINGRSNANMNHIVAKKRVIHMLFLVTTVFVVCWGPNQIFFLMFNLRVLDISYLNGLVHRSLGVLAFANSWANVFIYTIRYPQFRLAMCDMFRGDSKSKATLFGEVTAQNQRRSKSPLSNV